MPPESAIEVRGVWKIFGEFADEAFEDIRIQSLQDILADIQSTSSKPQTPASGSSPSGSECFWR